MCDIDAPILKIAVLWALNIIEVKTFCITKSRLSEKSIAGKLTILGEDSKVLIKIILFYFN